MFAPDNQQLIVTGISAPTRTAGTLSYWWLLNVSRSSELVCRLRTTRKFFLTPWCTAFLQ